jgi:hypothetical protein
VQSVPQPRVKKARLVKKMSEKIVEKKYSGKFGEELRMRKEKIAGIIYLSRNVG